VLITISCAGDKPLKRAYLRENKQAAIEREQQTREIAMRMPVGRVKWTRANLCSFIAIDPHLTTEQHTFYVHVVTQAAGHFDTCIRIWEGQAHEEERKRRQHQVTLNSETVLANSSEALNAVVKEVFKGDPLEKEVIAIDASKIQMQPSYIDRCMNS
jgi:hypothetical protein